MQSAVEPAVLTNQLSVDAAHRHAISTGAFVHACFKHGDHSAAELMLTIACIVLPAGVCAACRSLAVCLMIRLA
jgi:hypothetical protein